MLSPASSNFRFSRDQRPLTCKLSYHFLSPPTITFSFTFSLLSCRAKETATYAKKKVDLVWCFESSGNSVTLRSKEESPIHLKMTSGPFGRVTGAKLNGEMVPVYRNVQSRQMCIGRVGMSGAERWKLFETLNDLLFSIFKIQDCQLYGTNFYHKKLVLKYTKKLKMVEISGREPTVFLMDNCLDEYSIEVLKVNQLPIDQSPAYYGTLRAKILECEDLDWLTMQSFWDMDCETVTLNSRCLGKRPLNELVRRWMIGGWKNLKEFKMRAIYSNDDLFDILEGIEAEVDEDRFR